MDKFDSVLYVKENYKQEFIDNFIKRFGVGVMDFVYCLGTIPTTFNVN